MLGGVIAEFLARVGFQADSASLDSALGEVKTFGVAIGAVAAGASAAILGIAGSYDELGAQSDRLGVPVAKLQELRYVAEQTGSSADALMSSLEGMRDKNPAIRDAGAALERAGRQMRGLSKGAQEVFAANMGIDPKLIPMLTSDVAALRIEFASMYATAGVDGQAAARSARGLIAEVDKLKTMGRMVADAVAVSLFAELRAGAERLRRGIVDNFGRIKRVLEGLIAFALRVTGTLAAFAGRIIGWVMDIADWFEALDKGQQAALASIAGLLVAWRLLNAGFLATPLGMIIGGLAAIIALVDDFLTWQEGGESLFDWSPWAASILQVVDALRPLADILLAALGGVLQATAPVLNMSLTLVSGLAKQIGLVFRFWKAIFTGDLPGALEIFQAAIQNILDTVAAMFGHFTEAVRVYFNSTWSAIEKAFPDFAAWARAAWAAIAPVVGLIGGAFKGLFGAIRPILRAVVAALGGLMEQVRLVADLLWSVFTGDLGGILTAAKGLFDSFAATIAAVFGHLADAVRAIFSALWPGVEAAFPNFAAWAEGAARAITGAFGGALDWVRDKLDAVLSLMPDALRDRLGLGASTASVPDLAAPALAPSAVAAVRAQALPAATASGVTIQQQTDIHVTAAGDAEATGRAVARQQGDVNAQIVRNARGAAR